VRVNCAAIPRDLVESEMFGHEKGSFTGATDRRIGRFELAHTGTLLLDEVGDLGPEAQAKLLRAIEAKEVERVGGGKPIRVDVRIVSATNKDLGRCVHEGTFREDLFFRLNVIPIPLPPLRERPSDIPALVRHFSALHRTRTGQPQPQWAEGAMALLTRYRWPGNVRELANIVERLSILHAGSPVEANDVATVISVDGDARRGNAQQPALPDPAALDASLSETLDDYEKMLITRALSMAGGNVAEAARKLKTDRPNLYRRMRRLGISIGSEE
jgi:two-component system nitrogen regulation response regulator NtrX